MGETTKPALKVRFDRRVRLEFRGATITSDAWLLAARELDEALGLMEMATGHLTESRTGRNVQHQLVPLLRQAVYSRLAGYEDTNPPAADRAVNAGPGHARHRGLAGARQAGGQHQQHEPL
jgi:hypothetical protein